MCARVCACALRMYADSSSVLLSELKAMTHARQKKTKKKKGQEANKAQAADHLPGCGEDEGGAGVALSTIHLAADSLSSLHEQKVAVCEERARDAFVRPPSPGASASLPSPRCQL